MTPHSPSDDPELRALLDSIGMRSQDESPEHADRARAELELRRILDRSQDGRVATARPTRRRTAVLALALAAVCAVVLVPLTLMQRSSPASSGPTALQFAAPRPHSGSDPFSHSAPISTVIDMLGARAGRQAHGATAKAQSIETYAEGVGIRIRTVSLASLSPAALPHDHRALAQRLTSGPACKGASAACALAELTDLYSTYTIPPAIAADLWHAIARLPGITDLGTTNDRIGRPAIGLSATTSIPGERLIVLADAHTGALLGSETVRGSERVVTFTVIGGAAHIDRSR